MMYQYQEELKKKKITRRIGGGTFYTKNTKVYLCMYFKMPKMYNYLFTDMLPIYVCDLNAGADRCPEKTVFYILLIMTDCIGEAICVRLLVNIIFIDKSSIVNTADYFESGRSYWRRRMGFHINVKMSQRNREVKRNSI